MRSMKVNDMWKFALTVIFALALSNFLYQALTTQEWDVAFERAWFQAIAIVIFVFAWLHQ